MSINNYTSARRPLTGAETVTNLIDSILKPAQVVEAKAEQPIEPTVETKPAAKKRGRKKKE